jgi:hypothetical protein
MKECKFSETYFGHLTFYYEPNIFNFPISAIIDRSGIVICFGFWGLNWTWKKEIEG